VDEVSPWCEQAKSHERERAEGAELAIAYDTVVVRAEGYLIKNTFIKA
jgi:hypothetical protein